MNRYKCSNCKGNQYSSSYEKTDEPCVYCGHAVTELMKGIEESEGDKNETSENRNE